MCSPLIFAVKRKSIAPSPRPATRSASSSLSQPVKAQQQGPEPVADPAASLRGSKHRRYDRGRTQLSAQDPLGFDPSVARSRLTGV